MDDFRNIEEYKSYIKDLSIDKLRDIERSIDKETYPERYDLVKNLIGKHTAKGVGKGASDANGHPPGLIFIRNAYVFLLILGGIAVLVNLSRLAVIDIIQAIGVITVELFIVYGISRKKAWVVLLTLFTSWSEFLGYTAYLVGKKLGDDADPVNMTIIFMYLVFIAHRITIFSNVGTKKYFACRSEVLIWKR